MTNDKELSDLKIERKECPKCRAIWINGEHRWATGAMGNEADLAGLVCNKLGDDACINPIKGDETGDSWEKRLLKMETSFGSLHDKMTDIYKKDEN